MCKEIKGIKGINASADVGEYLGFKLNALLNMDEKGSDAIGMDEETQEAEPERKLAGQSAERASLKGKLSEMKARVVRDTCRKGCSG